MPEIERTEPVEAKGDPVAVGGGAIASGAGLDRKRQEYPGTGRLIGTPEPSPDVEDSIRDVVLNLEEAAVSEVVKVILGDILKQNYVIDPDVSGRVSVQSHRGFARDGLIELLELLLGINNAVIIRESGGLYRILPYDKAKTIAVPPLASRNRGSLESGYRTELISLRFITASELKKVLQPYLSARVELVVEEQRNVVMLAGSGTEIDKLREAIAVFDVDWLAGMSFGLYPIVFTEATVLAEELKSLISGDGTDADAGIIRITPIDRLNSIMVVTPQAAYLDRVQSWIERLDKSGNNHERRLFVYRVQNGKAIDLANVLNQIFEKPESFAKVYPRPELAPGLEPVEIESEADESKPRLPSRRATDSRSAATDSARPQIIADEINNALVFMASPSEHEMLLAALRELDVAPLQVLIEASIVEVTLTDDLEYGVEWFFKNNVNVGGSDKQGSGLLDLGAPGLAPLAPGFSYALIDNANQVRAMINLLASESELNVLSSPSLMVLGNQTATINVGDEVPIPTRQSVSNIDPAAPTVNEIEYRDTGVILEVTPRVNSGGLVTMEISQEVSDVGPTTTSGIDAPTFQQRKIASTVAVQSGNTVVLGGLIRDRAVVVESGIPFLYKLPVLGKLFGATSNQARRTELLVLITPRAIANTTEATNITEEFRTKLRGLR